MPDNLIERYLTNMAQVRETRSNVAETSFYPALERLLTDIGKGLSPKVRCVINLANRGAGFPDAGLFSADQFPRKARDDNAKENPLLIQTPSRGVIEAKPPADDVHKVAETEQVERYWKKYGMVLVTNFRAFTLIGKGPTGRPSALESFTLAESEREFWNLTAHPRKAADEHGERMVEYLKRVLLHNAPLAAPQDVASILASYAHDARLRIEKADLPALTSLRQALEDSLGLHFEGEKGEHFFRSTLVQTLFYGVFSAWVLWARRRDAEPDKKTGFADALHETGAPYSVAGGFDWRIAPYLLRVPMLRALFIQVADPARLGALGLIEVLDWTATALNRVNHAEFFKSFDEGHAVQYFYEPFLQEFDPELRKELGVWYTPEEIVRYQVERVDAVLRSELGLADGLADPKVVVLDPCCGTGAYLRAVLRRIAVTLRDKGGDALVANDLKKAAMERVFGFEILPAPFVIAHLQLGLELETLGAPLSDRSDPPERAGVYLTNALTGWEPPKEKPKQIAFPGFEEERDDAGKVKQEKPILVILGNPPYNAFAGVSPEEEQGLVEPYKKGLISEWGIKKFNLDDLYIRFFRLAEKRIAEHGGRGVVSFISNHSWISDPSFVVMRRHLLDSFDRFWIENMHGNRKISEYAPDGRTSETVFATSGFSVGIQQGVAISLWVKNVVGPAVGPAASPVYSETAGLAASQDLTGQRPVPQNPQFKPFDPEAAHSVRRRHLPHWHQPGATYFVTWRLADSIPQQRLAEWREESDLWLAVHPLPWTNEVETEYWDRFVQRFDDWLGECLGSCVLAEPTLSAVVEECLLHFNGVRYALWRYVIMPNHVHALVVPFDGFELSKILHTWKGFTAKRINAMRGLSGSLWQDESFDHIVRTEAYLAKFIRYIDENPAKAHLSATVGPPVVGPAASPVSFDTARNFASQDMTGQRPEPLGTMTGQRPEPQVFFRNDLDDAKADDRRKHLLDSLNVKRFDVQYETSNPRKDNRWSFRPSDVSSDYYAWPTALELCEVKSDGMFEKRNGGLIDIEKDVLQKRMRQYYDLSNTWEYLVQEQHPLTLNASDFDARKARQRIINIENYNPENICPYSVRPYDHRWCYFSSVNPLWNRSRPILWSQYWKGNRFLVTRLKSGKTAKGSPIYFTELLVDGQTISVNASAIPIRLLSNAAGSIGRQGKHANQVLLDINQPSGKITANLSRIARAFLASLGLPDPDTDQETAELIWYHSLAIGYSPAYLSENADGIRQDWPRIPLPKAKDSLLASSALGRQIAALLDTEAPVSGVTAGKIRDDLKSIAVFQRVDGKPAKPETADLDLTAGWGHAGKGGVTMPGKGKWIRRGDGAYDIFLNDVACWRNVPESVWEYAIGGYQVIKKWLSYREKPLLGRGFTPDEVRYVTEMARRLAALIALQPSLDENYRHVIKATYPWTNR